MKILQLSSLYPPNTKGGAELSAFHLGQWLTDAGHEVGVVTTAASGEEELSGEIVSRIYTWRVKALRPYPVHEHDSPSSVTKVLWHLLDHFDPRNTEVIRPAVESFKPDVIVVHLLAGIGHNSLAALDGFGSVPIVYVLHDLGLACLRSSMYRDGKNCRSQCWECKISSNIKRKYLRNQAKICFVSPSAANLKSVLQHVELEGHETYVVPNLDLDTPVPRVSTKPNGKLRLGYVGRIHGTKGVPFLLSVLARVAETYPNLQATIVGSGPLEAELRRNYEHFPWVTFTGRLPPSDVRFAVADMDVLCVPSIWRENHPGVIRQALRAGVPAIVSDVGGLRK